MGTVMVVIIMVSQDAKTAVLVTTATVWVTLVQATKVILVATEMLEA